MSVSLARGIAGYFGSMDRDTNSSYSSKLTPGQTVSAIAGMYT